MEIYKDKYPLYPKEPPKVHELSSVKGALHLRLVKTGTILFPLSIYRQKCQTREREGCQLASEVWQ